LLDGILKLKATPLVGPEFSAENVLRDKATFGHDKF
jgi:hypothetical protein